MQCPYCGNLCRNDYGNLYCESCNRSFYGILQYSGFSISSANYIKVSFETVNPTKDLRQIIEESKTPKELIEKLND